MTHGTGTLMRRARPLERPVQDAEWHLCPREGVGAAALGPCLPACPRPYGSSETDAFSIKPLGHVSAGRSGRGGLSACLAGLRAMSAHVPLAPAACSSASSAGTR